LNLLNFQDKRLERSFELIERLNFFEPIERMELSFV